SELVTRASATGLPPLVTCTVIVWAAAAAGSSSARTSARQAGIPGLADRLPRQRRVQIPGAFDLQKASLRVDPANGRNPSCLPSRRQHTVTRHDDGKRIPAES